MGGPVGGHAERRMGGGGPAGVGGATCAWSATAMTPAATPGHAWERQGKREKGESRGAGEWGPANSGKGAGDRWGRLQCRWFKLNQIELNQFERI
jgi:hypothetical protein